MVWHKAQNKQASTEVQMFIFWPSTQPQKMLFQGNTKSKEIAWAD